MPTSKRTTPKRQNVVPIPQELPAYDPPSWEMYPKGRDASETEFSAIMCRYAANLRWFVARPRSEYTVAEAAELLAEAPDELGAQSRKGKIQREKILRIALDRGVWGLDTFEVFAREGIDCDDHSSCVPGERLCPACLVVWSDAVVETTRKQEPQRGGK